VQSPEDVRICTTQSGCSGGDSQPLTLTVLRNRFEKAKKAAGAEFQFRDIRAKAATDTGDLAHSQKLLAHKNRDMTEHYVRFRVGERVRPLR
jgi:integrase